MAVGSWKSIVTLVFFVIANAIVIHPLEFEIIIPIFVQAIGTNFIRLAYVLSNRRCPTTPPRDGDARLRFLFKFNYSTAPVVIVFFLWAITAIDSDIVRQGIVGANGVQPLSIMALFISLAYLSVSLDQTGLFGFLAVWVAKRGKSSGRRLFLLLYLFFFACAVLFGNDPVVLSGTPFLAHFTRYSGIDPPTAWILAQFIPANTASAILPPSNPTNLVVTSAFSISFLSFAAHTVVPTLLVAFSQYILLRYIQFNSPASIPKTFTLDSVQPVEREEDVEMSARPSSSRLTTSSGGQHNIGKLSDKLGAVFGSALFISTLLVLLGTSVRRIPVWWVTVPSAVTMGIRDILHDRKRWRKQRSVQTGSPIDTASVACEEPRAGSDLHSQPKTPLRTLMRTFETRLPTFSKIVQGLPLAMIPFAFAMFILVQALTVSGWIEVFSKWWSAWVNVCGSAGSLRAVVGTVFGMLILSVLMCNFCGTNIGATIFLSQIVSRWVDAASSSGQTPIDPRIREAAIYALALGVNFGAYSFVFSASLAGLLWRGILEKNGINRIKVRQRDFAVQNIPSLVVAIAVSAVAIFVEVIVIVKQSSGKDAERKIKTV